MTPLDLLPGNGFHLNSGIPLVGLCFLALAVYRTFFRGRGGRRDR